MECHGNEETPDYDFVLYIDEAGDPGLKSVAPMDRNGASEWMTLGGVLIRKKYESETVKWVRDIRTQINALQGPALHFRTLSPTKKIAACEHLATLPLRAFCVASHKPNMKNHRNIKAEKLQNADWFYNWCLRLLLERATTLVNRQSIKEFGSPRKLKVILEERGGHSYGQTAAYIYKLQQQAKTGTTVLQKREIHPDVLDFRLVESVNANSSAGAQLADIVSSAFYTSVRRVQAAAPFIEPATRLHPVIGRENGRARDFGLVLQPHPKKANLHPTQKEIFRHYGYAI